MLFVVLHGSDVVGVMTSAVDAALIAKPLQAQIWICQPNSCEATMLQEPVLPSDRPRTPVRPEPEPELKVGRIENVNGK